jgi:hypothetical protein
MRQDLSFARLKFDQEEEFLRRINSELKVFVTGSKPLITKVPAYPYLRGEQKYEIEVNYRVLNTAALV